MTLATPKKMPATDAEPGKKPAPSRPRAAKKAVPTPVSAPPELAAAKPAAKRPPAKKTAPRKKVSVAAAAPLDPAQRAHYVQVAAFYIAERRGFTAADPMEDWLAAEAEIDRLIASGQFNR